VHRLLLLRHAKSSWADPGTRDHERPLNERGRAAADRMGRHLHTAGLVPDLALCSSARRTCETLARLDLPATVGIAVDPDLYLADPDTVLDRIRAVDEAVTTLLVVGHNPTTQELALDLAGGGAGDPATVHRIAGKYPTGALTVLTVTRPWAALAPGTARLDAFVTPRDLETADDPR
jgi:phosphohistidine phosphatase